MLMRGCLCRKSEMAKDKTEIDIIGAGVAGLSLGILLEKGGIKTTIYERHSRTGGLCCNWTRGRYTFNGCIHWVLGAGKKSGFYDIWKKLLDVQKLDWVLPDERLSLQTPMKDRNGDDRFHLWTDIDKFDEYLLNIAPEDQKVIRKWTGMVRCVREELEMMPPKGVWTIVKHVLNPLSLYRLLRILFFVRGWGRLDNREYAKQFGNVFLRYAVEHLYARPTIMTAVVFTQAYMSGGVAKYPLGGSQALTDKLEESYRALGGTLRLSTPVEEIIVEKDKAVGVRLKDGSEHRASGVVSAADWHWTIYKALGGKYLTEKAEAYVKPKKEDVYYSYCRVFIGVRNPMEGVPHFARYVVPGFKLADGTEYEELEVETYNHDPRLAPEGCCVMAVNLLTQEGQWWIDKRRDDRKGYQVAKENVKEKVIALLDDILEGNWKAAIEETDVVTPATYNRYTGNLYGSSQGWMPLKNLSERHPLSGYTLDGLDGFMMCGHWTTAGGGLPIAISSAKAVAEYIKKKIKE